MKFLIALVLAGLLGTVVWNYKGAKPRVTTSFIDNAKYIAITYSDSPECKDQYGNYPDSTVASDFDGDGQLDRARIAKKDADHEILVVWLSSKGFKPAILEEINVPGSMMISLAKANQIITNACAKGPAECKAGDLKEVKLQNDSFRITKCRSSSSVFYWNPDHAMLDRMETSH